MPVPVPDLRALGIEIARRRRDLGMSIDRLAEASGVHRKSIIQIEAGRVAARSAPCTPSRTLWACRCPSSSPRSAPGTRSRSPRQRLWSSRGGHRPSRLGPHPFYEARHVIRVGDVTARLPAWRPCARQRLPERVRHRAPWVTPAPHRSDASLQTRSAGASDDPLAGAHSGHTASSGDPTSPEWRGAEGTLDPTRITTIVECFATTGTMQDAHRRTAAEAASANGNGL